jgi:hypothetical protein
LGKASFARASESIWGVATPWTVNQATQTQTISATSGRFTLRCRQTLLAGIFHHLYIVDECRWYMFALTHLHLHRISQKKSRHVWHNAQARVPHRTTRKRPSTTAWFGPIPRTAETGTDGVLETVIQLWLDCEKWWSNYDPIFVQNWWSHYERLSLIWHELL